MKGHEYIFVQIFSSVNIYTLLKPTKNIYIKRLKCILYNFGVLKLKCTCVVMIPVDMKIKINRKLKNKKFHPSF